MHDSRASKCDYVTDTPLRHSIKDQQRRRYDRVQHPRTGTRPRRVYSRSQSRFCDFLGGQRGMEIAFVLLLIVPLIAAIPLRPTHRSEEDAVHPVNAVQPSEVKTSEDTQEQHAKALRIVPFHSGDRYRDLDAMKHSMAARLRPPRAPQRGCQLGTCQVHNLANTLYHIGKTNGKDKSKTARDPQGYGR